MTEFRREIRVESPAYDRMAEGGRVGCVVMSFALVGEHGAALLAVSTGWDLPEVQKRNRRVHPASGRFVEVHADHPLWEDGSPATDDCRYTGGKCWTDAGYCAGDELFEILVAKGEDALFAKLEEWYFAHVEPQAVELANTVAGGDSNG